MKRKKFQPFALVCLGLATVCLASCSSQDSNGVTKELKYVEGSLDKTTYKVGETLDLTGLEVKLFTTTNGVTDNGIIYTNFETSVQEGYKFTEDDVTEEGEYFKVVISAKDDNVATTSFDLTIVSDTQDTVRKYIDYTHDSSFKTSYEVGEALDLTGLEIKLFTETNGITDSGVVFTDYTTNPQNGYVFKEEDVSNEAEPFNLIVIPNDSTISSLTIELTVKEGEVEFIPVETTPAEFISNLKDKMTYEFDNELYSGKVTPNANYFVYKNNESASYGYAQNSSEIIRYVIQRGGIKKDQTFTKDEYESMYDESFFLDICNPDAMPNSTAFTFPQASLDYLATLTCVEGTNDYPIDIKKAHDVIALIAPTQVPNDPYLDLSYGSDARIKLTMVSDSEMRITVSNTSSMLSLPVDTTIKFNEEVSIPEIEEFVNDSESTEGQEVLAKIKEKLNADNYTSEVVVDGTTYTTVSTKDYYYTNNPNATYENDIKIGANSAGLDEGHYTYTITDGVFTLGNKYDLESEETQYESKLISSNSIVSGFDSNFVYDTENDMYFYTLSAEEPNYFISAPAFYALVTGNEKVVGISEILCTYTLDNGDVSSINLSFYNGSNLLTSAKLSKFGSSEVSAIESYLDSIK